MHEMGVVLQIVQTADEFALEQQVEQVKTLTVQIGEASGVLPRYVDLFFTEVIKDYPRLKHCTIRTEAVPVKLFCFDCGNVWTPSDDDHSCHDHEPKPVQCPECTSKKYRFIEGRNVMIKEMEVG